MAKKLSTLICSLANRAESLKHLMSVLDSQLNDDVEVITHIDSGLKFVGEKRNELIAEAQGEYICFIDDDDTVSHDYVDAILQAINDNPGVDAIGFNGQIHHIPRNKKMLVEYKHGNEDKQVGDIYYRSIWHLQPIKREIALQVGFPGKVNRGEDKNYADGIKPLIRNATFINKVLYYYNASY